MFLNQRSNFLGPFPSRWPSLNHRIERFNPSNTPHDDKSEQAKEFHKKMFIQAQRTGSRFFGTPLLRQGAIKKTISRHRDGRGNKIKQWGAWWAKREGEATWWKRDSKRSTMGVVSKKTKRSGGWRIWELCLELSLTDLD